MHSWKTVSLMVHCIYKILWQLQSSKIKTVFGAHIKERKRGRIGMWLGKNSLLPAGFQLKFSPVTTPGTLRHNNLVDHWSIPPLSSVSNSSLIFSIKIWNQSIHSMNVLSTTSHCLESLFPFWPLPNFKEMSHVWWKHKPKAVSLLETIFGKA